MMKVGTSVTIKTRLLAISLFFGILPIVAMFVAANQAGLGMNREFHNTMAVALMVTVLAGLLSPGIIRYWLFASQVKQIKEFCQHVKAGRYDVYLNVPNERNDDGNENELVDLMRDMNWMVHRIKVNESELKEAVCSLEQSKAKVQSQKQALEEVNAAQLVVQQQLQGRTRELTEAVDKVRNLLDNAGQGFLSFGEDLQVAGEYSAECVMIFNQEISGKMVPELLYPADKRQQAFLAALFDQIFAAEDTFLRDSYLSLLPEELVLEDSYIQVAYKLINHPLDPQRREILLILTDITEQREMERKIQEEKQVLSMVVKAVTHYQEFNAAIAEYQLFCQEELPALIAANEPAGQKLNTLFRIIHTWKGTFSQLGICRLAAELHELESALAALREETADDIGQSGLDALFSSYSPEVLAGWLKTELEQLKEILGEGFFLADESIVIENHKLQQLEEKIQRLLEPCQARILIAELHRLRYKPFGDLLNIYPDYIANVALNQGKEIQPLLITGSKPLVDPEIYHEFAKSLVHVFRNAVAHGLENPDERLEAGKAAQGRISCVIADQGDNLTVAIGDDGRGIAAERMRQLAVAKGMYSESEAAALTDVEAIRLIFADGFSSTCAANELSGRGVGLSAVRQETEKLGGRVDIITEPGKGTQFIFVLPLAHLRKDGEENGTCIGCR